MAQTKTENTSYLVGFFSVEGVPGTQSVETPLTGQGGTDYATLTALVRKKFPTAGRVTRTGSTIELRTVGVQNVEYPVGATLKQLFGEDDEGSVKVGTVLFNGECCEVVLRYHRAKNIVGVTLRERSTGVPIRFSDPIKGMRLVREAPDIIKEVLGQGATDLALTLVETP